MPRVLNKRTDKIPPDAIYVGRPSKWGNMFKITKTVDRLAAVHRYKDWIEEQIRLGNVGFGKQYKYNLEELRGHDVVCWCTPLSCHADVLLELANK